MNTDNGKAVFALPEITLQEGLALETLSTSGGWSGGDAGI